MTNTWLWNSFGRDGVTDERYVKEVKGKGYKHHSIDATYRLQLMTEAFGPVGHAWSYTANYETVDKGPYTIVIASVQLFWKTENETNAFGPVASSCAMISPVLVDRKPARDSQGEIVLRYDDDAHKKALTDALTKAMSHLGMCHDVYLGQFDDDKYREFSRVTYASEEEIMARARTRIASLKEGDENLHTNVTLLRSLLLRRVAENRLSMENANSVVTEINNRLSQWARTPIAPISEEEVESSIQDMNETG